MPSLADLLAGVLAPAILAGMVLALSWRVWRATRIEAGSGAGTELPDGRALGGVAVGAAMFLAYGLLIHWPVLPGGPGALPVLDRVAWIALLVGPVLLLEHPLRRFAPLLRLACATAVVWWVLDAFGRASDRRQFGMSLGGLVLLGTGLQLLARRARGPSFPLALMAAGAATAVTVGYAVSDKMAKLEGALVAALGAAWVLTLWRRRVTLAGPALAAWVLLHGALLTCAHIYGLALPDLVLVAVSPLAMWCVELPALRRRPAWQVGLLRIVFALAPAAVAAVRAAVEFYSDPYGY